MPPDLRLLSEKLRKYRAQFELSFREISDATGIGSDLLESIEKGERAPSGDQLLILADFFKCDYQVFLSDTAASPLDRTETLFRRFGKEFNKADRWSVQEFLFLCESEEFLNRQSTAHGVNRFTFTPEGTFFKGHADQAANALRAFLHYPDHAVPRDVYFDFRSLGIHVFRRQLQNSNISGLYVNHPTAGDCVLVNYSEDVYRQRFTVAHEAAHAIFDRQEQVVVSFWDKKELVEIRANAFASRFLLPPSFLAGIPDPRNWHPEKLVKWANELRVNTEPLLIALSDTGLIDHGTRERLKAVKVPLSDKLDPELPASLAPLSRERKRALLERGLSVAYVALCFEAYHRDIVSAARLAELLLLDGDEDLRQLALLYNERLEYGA
jgi:Zn-dependent peptidase ImmA (M78 family)/transcriptional regulator with XRE-family HTH domain